MSRIPLGLAATLGDAFGASALPATAVAQGAVGYGVYGAVAGANAWEEAGPVIAEAGGVGGAGIGFVQGGIAAALGVLVTEGLNKALVPEGCGE